MNRWLICIVGLLVSCSETQQEVDAPEITGPDPQAWELTAEEKAWVESRKPQGLRVASTELEGTFMKTPKGFTGFQADLARSLGDFLGLNVTFEAVPFNRYFSKDGVVPDAVKTDPNLTYVPDVFAKADLAAFNLSELPWRRKLMDFHAVFLSRVVLITARGQEITQLSELANRRVVVIENTSHELFMRKLQTQLGVPFTILSKPFETDLFDLVRSGGADALVRDAYGAMMLLQKNRDFNVTLPLMPTEWVKWAVAKKDTVFGSIVEKFLLRSRETGEMAALWEKAHGLSFEDYQNLIGDDPALEWSTAELQVLANLARTGLRVGIDPEQTIYEPLANGAAKGITYNLLLEVAKRLDVPLKVHKVAFRQYFDKNGKFPEQVKTDPSFTYRPDLLDQVDLYADTLSPVEWRKKFLGFVSLYPSKLVWLVRKDGVRAPAKDKKIALLSHSSYEDWVKATGVPGQVLQTASGDQAVRMVAEGKADLTVSDANLALGWLAKYPDITFFPADTETQDLSWGVAKENEALRSVLNKVLDSIRHSGRFSTIWQSYYHVPFDEYLTLLSVDKSR